MWDYRFPWLERLYLSAVSSVGYYPRKRAYSFPFFQPGSVRPGSNDSDDGQYVQTPGRDNWLDIKLEYVLPFGAAKKSGMRAYRLQKGILQSEPSGGSVWNPLESGVTVLMLKQYNRYQSYEPENHPEVDGTIHPLQFGLYYDNTDFPANPSFGSSQFLAYTYDFAWLDSEEEWDFIEFEASRYFSLGASDWARQRVIALNAWTGYSLSWDEEMDENGNIRISHRPPYFDGATLGGFYRMRGYESHRFNDRAVIYATAEYRYTLDWNPFAGVSWLRFLQTDWFQLVGFIEGGRVADDYDLSDLFSEWKADAGIGIRTLMAGAVIRLDIGASDEGVNGWVMFGHPF
jgi:outer membrane protein assembly factor BamA